MPINENDLGLLRMVANEFFPGEPATHESLRRKINMVMSRPKGDDPVGEIAARSRVPTQEVVDVVAQEID